MYSAEFKEYIALGRTMRIFRNTLHSDVQYGFLGNTLHSDVQCGFLKECIALGRTMIKMSNVMNAKMQPNAQMQTNADYF